MKKHSKTVEEGSKTAKGGFENEKLVKTIFNDWKINERAKTWIKSMGKEPEKITTLNAFLPKELGLPNGKADVILKIDSKKEGISIKRFSAGFNQIDKRWADKYADLWKIPENVLNVLKKYAGQEGFRPVDLIKEEEKLESIKDRRRYYLNELATDEKNLVLGFFKINLHRIIKDLFQGQGETKADWLLVVKYEDEEIIDSKLISIEKAIQHYSKGGISVTAKGNIKLGKITLQRKGGDGGRETAQMLQFKFSPDDVLMLE